jgi:hypothetical protein
VSETKTLLTRISYFLDLNKEKPLVGSQITFAIRTVKEALNGNGKAGQKGTKKASPGS